MYYPHHHSPQQTPSNTANDGCFWCHQVGHWAKDCPQRTQTPNKRGPISNNRTPIPHFLSTSEYPATQCRCGAGFCEIRISHSGANPNRQYYCCPGKFENYCKFFKWCDQLKPDEVQVVRPEEPYPTCGCGAGVCIVETTDGRSYFVCPIKKGYGACMFRQGMEEDQELYYWSSETVMEIDAVVRRALDFSSEVVEVHVENGVDWSSGIAHGIPGSSEVLHSVENNISGNGSDFEITAENDILLNLGDSQVKNVDESMTKATATLEIPFSQGAGSFSEINPPVMAEDKSLSEGSLKLDELLPKQSMLKSGQNERKFVTDFILQPSEKLSHHPQNDLTVLLESVSPVNLENMMKECYTFAALDFLQDDNEPFHLLVIEYIKQAAVLSCMKRTIKDDVACMILSKTDQTHFQEIFFAFCEAGKAYMASNERLATLRENASCVTDLSMELEEELWCCKVENDNHRDSFLQVTKSLSECIQREHAGYV